jgi:hypothetical protein
MMIGIKQLPSTTLAVNHTSLMRMSSLTTTTWLMISLTCQPGNYCGTYCMNMTSNFATICQLTSSTVWLGCLRSCFRHFQQHWRSRFPTFNKNGPKEPVTTETVLSDTPAVVIYFPAAQHFVGRHSLVVDACCLIHR